MNVITRSDQTEQLDRATAGMQGKEASINHTGGHSTKWPMLLCVAGMIAAIATGAALGFNVAFFFCAAMMVSMVWMMAAPAVKARRRDQTNR